MNNTKILYLYRDADNYKVLNECIVEGVITKEQQRVILDCLDEGEYFIPNQVGLPEKRFDDGVTEADHCWFELDESCFEQTTDAPTVNVQAEVLVNAFCHKKGRWDDSFLPSETKFKPSLSIQIQSASTRLSESRSTDKLPVIDSISER